MNTLKIINRDAPLISELSEYENILKEKISTSRFLVIGGAGSIGQAVVKELFLRNPKKLHVVDISENNMVELVRDLRSSTGYINSDFQTFAIDCGSLEFEIMFNDKGPYDYVLNLSALKHVRSEKDPYTLMRMVDVNILNTIKTLELSINAGVKKYFCVSTDKAANPVNMMGASKRIMEMFLFYYSEKIEISTARFANVAFSDGSLLHGFQQRLMKNQPIAAPNDIKRYFITKKEAGELCLVSTILGKNKEIFFPKLNNNLKLTTFTQIADEFLEQNGYTAYECESENEARHMVDDLKKDKKWPCFFDKSNTTGEKNFEEFYTIGEDIDLDRFESLGIINNSYYQHDNKLDLFLDSIKKYKENKQWTKENILSEIKKVLPDFKHSEKGKNLDCKM